MESYSLTHGLKDGTRLSLWEAPLWAILIERHWPAGPSMRPFENIWWHLTQAVFKFTHRQYKKLTEIPVTDEQAETICPGGFTWVSDDQPPAELGMPVRLIPRPESTDRAGLKGEIINVTWDTQDGEDATKVRVRFENGAEATVRPEDLIDIRLIWEK